MPALDSVGSLGVALGRISDVSADVIGVVGRADRAPMLAFVGALVVAVIAAWTANRRQDRALAAESERQRQALQAEADRLRMQLLHDRELADVADARSVLDDAVRALHDAEYARQGVYLAGPAAVDAEGLARVDAAGRILDALATRLAFRLGPDSDAVRHYTAAADALLSIRRDAGVHPHIIDPLDQWRKIEAASVQFATSVRGFVAAAKEAAGADLTTPSRAP